MKNRFVLMFGIITLFLFIRVDASTMPSASEYGTITLTEDITLDSTFFVSSGEEIILDLNGHSLTNMFSEVICVNEGGKLTITGNGTINKSSTDVSAIQSYGELIIENGTYNGQVFVGTNGLVEINGGTFIGPSGSKYPAVYVYGSAVINDGEFTSDDSYVVYGRGTSSNITINGGTFTGKSSSCPTFYIYGTIVIDGGVITNENGIVIGGMTGSKTTITNGNIRGFINVESDGLLEISGGSFINNSDNEDNNYLISNTSSNVVSISGGTYTYSSALLSSTSTETAVINGAVTGPLELNSYAESGAIITLNESVDSDETLEIIDGVQILVPPTVSFKIKDITGAGDIDVTDDRYEIVYVDSYYIMRLKEVVAESDEENEEEIINPATDVDTPYIVSFILTISSIILIFLYRKKKYM